MEDAFAVAPSAADGARSVFWGAADACDAFVAEHGLCPSGRPRASSERVRAPASPGPSFGTRFPWTILRTFFCPDYGWERGRSRS